MDTQTQTFVIAVAAWFLVFGGFGAWVSSQKGRGQGEGAVLGFLFGPLGILVAALMPQKYVERLPTRQGAEK
jgi:hypothetical protein